MEFGKKSNIRGKWQFVFLSEDEINKALEELFELNTKQAKMCVSKKDSELPDEINKLVIQSQMVSPYTYLSAVLDKRISELNDKE